ncbi:DUF1707 domain-containing protein [Mycobacterium sp. E3305]|uniref:DUF1707 SHOCT-like domain-containing protein n=1 Tax=Mycobacterium sp. E3305 TaxID=1834145 RepID=UPI003510A44B
MPHPMPMPSSTDTTNAAASTRAKDVNRQDACKILDNALNDGELSMEEHRERVSAATKAVTLGDLQDLVSDLQTDSSALPTTTVRTRPVPPRLGGWGVLAAAPPPSDVPSHFATGRS